jgi:hypothetical protein
MPIKKREERVAPAAGDEESIAKRAEEFGRGGYAPEEAEAAPLDPNAPVGPQGIVFRFNDYQKQLLKESAEDDRRSQQKLLESIVWPELERRREAKGR